MLSVVTVSERNHRSESVDTHDRVSTTRAKQRLPQVIAHVTTSEGECTHNKGKLELARSGKVLIQGRGSVPQLGQGKAGMFYFRLGKGPT